MGIWTALIGLVGVIAGTVVTYAVARRKSSGNVGTSEAETLWAEANSLRQAYREQADERAKEAVTLRSELVALHAEIVALRADMVGLREENVSCKERVSLLEVRLAKALGERGDRG